MADPAIRPRSTAHGVPAASPRVAAWMPSGMLDWPGKVAATVFLSGCSLHCPYCHNPSLRANRASMLTLEGLVASLAPRRRWLDGVVVTGGEPTEDPDLRALLTALSAAGFPVKLDTNGTRPEVLRTLIADGLVDYIALDVKTIPSRYPRVSESPDAAVAVAESVALVLDSGLEHEFRTTVYPGLVGLDELPDIAAGLAGGRLYALQQFRPAVTFRPEAAEVPPYEAAHLNIAADLCSRHLPTIVRGAA